MNTADNTPRDKSREAVVEYVDRAVALLRRDGYERAAASFQTNAWHRGDWYIFILDERGVILCHPARADMVGKSPENGMFDVRGVPFGRHMVEQGWSPAGRGWVEYEWPRADRTIATKHSYVTGVVLDDGTKYIVGSGGFEM